MLAYRMSYSRTIMGMMSGTSGDGIDAAVVGFGPNQTQGKPKLVEFDSLEFPPDFRARLFAIRESDSMSLGELSQFTRDLTLLHAELAKRMITKVGKVDLIAVHGQTLFHAPPLTMQVFDPSLLAMLSNTDVASDFRRADCAAGGQGAPLVPLADHVLFAHDDETRVMLNLGGIANITLLQASGPIDAVTAFDTGPANCVLDHLWRLHSRVGLDQNGAVALTGKANLDISKQAAMTADGLWDKRPPKSTDTPAMIRAFADAGGEQLSLPDALATACHMSAMLLARGIEQLGSIKIDRLIASGGGVHNRALVSAIQAHTKLRWQITDDMGVPSQAKEAMAFAILGARLLDRLPGNIPRVTGAARSVVLGSISPATAPGPLRFG
jgi:anhydro-N-acetylmuramic acid kinase